MLSVWICTTTGTHHGECREIVISLRYNGECRETVLS